MQATIREIAAAADPVTREPSLVKADVGHIKRLAARPDRNGDRRIAEDHGGQSPSCRSRHSSKQQGKQCGLDRRSRETSTVSLQNGAESPAQRGTKWSSAGGSIAGSSRRDRPACTSSFRARRSSSIVEPGAVAAAGDMPAVTACATQEPGQVSEARTWSASAGQDAAAGADSRFNVSKLGARAPGADALSARSCFLILGVAAYFQLGQDEDPPFTFRAMALRVFWPGATAQQVAEQVTDKLERTLQEVPYSDKIRSYSKPGEALIIFQVKDNFAAEGDGAGLVHGSQEDRRHACDPTGRSRSVRSSTTNSATSTDRSSRCRPTVSATRN